MTRPRIANEGPTRIGQRPAEPCRGCGTVWGYVMPHCRRGERVHGLCHYCQVAARRRPGGLVPPRPWAVDEDYEPTHHAIERGCQLARLLAPRSPQGYGVVFRVHRTPAFLRPHLEVGP